MAPKLWLQLQPAEMSLKVIVKFPWDGFDVPVPNFILIEFEEMLEECIIRLSRIHQVAKVDAHEFVDGRLYGL